MDDDGLVPQRKRWALLARRWCFVAVSTVIVVVTSEKFYWYPQGFPRLDNLELVAFYSIGVLVFFAIVRRYGLTGAAGAILGSAGFALVVEGSVTPVVYEDGPFPVLALYFMGWHGVLSVVVSWYVFRHLSVHRRSGALAGVACGYGVLVGLWSTIYWLPSQIEEMAADVDVVWDEGRWSTEKFAAYVLVITAILVVAHRLLGAVWQVDWQIGQASLRWLAVLVAAGVVLWTFAVFYAPIKFVALALAIRWLITWSSPSDVAASDQPSMSMRPTLFESLAGTVTWRAVAPIALVAPAAIATYATVSAIDPTTAVLDVVYGGIVTVTTLAGLVSLVWAVRRRLVKIT